MYYNIKISENSLLIAHQVVMSSRGSRPMENIQTKLLPIQMEITPFNAQKVMNEIYRKVV
jgi:hypothetical protein